MSRLLWTKMLSFKCQGQGVVEHTYPSTTGEAEARERIMSSMPTGVTQWNCLRREVRKRWRHPKINDEGVHYHKTFLKEKLEKMLQAEKNKVYTTPNVYVWKNKGLGKGEYKHCWRSSSWGRRDGLAVLAGDLSLSPSTYMAAHNHPLPGDSLLSSGLCKY